MTTKKSQPAFFVHPTADVEKQVKIGQGSRIWHHCHLRTGARIGANCSLGRNVFIDTNVRLGNDVKVQNNVSIYEGVTIQEKVFVGPHVTFTNDPYPRAFPNGWRKTPTLIKKGASLGANSTIICGIVIGEYAMVGAGAVVTKNVPPFALVEGLGSRIVGYVSTNGHPVRHKSAKKARRNKRG